VRKQKCGAYGQNPFRPCHQAADAGAVSSEAAADQTTAAGESAESAAAGELKLVEAGKLIVSTNAEFPPYEYYDANEIEGIDVEIAKAIADKMGLELEIKDAAVDTIVISICGENRKFKPIKIGSRAQGTYTEMNATNINQVINHTLIASSITDLISDNATELWDIDLSDVYDNIKLFVQNAMIIREMDHKLEFSVEIPVYKK